jgi:hypothetical protein
MLTCTALNAGGLLLQDKLPSEEAKEEQGATESSSKSHSIEPGKSKNKERSASSSSINKTKGQGSPIITKEKSVDSVRTSKKKNGEEVANKKAKEEEGEDSRDMTAIGDMSEYSSLEDDDVPPARKKKLSNSPGAASASTKARKSGSKSGVKDSTESRLKKLKALVLECGTRKPWKKLFEDAKCSDVDNASEEEKRKIRKAQVIVVEEALREIGMVRINICLAIEGP